MLGLVVFDEGQEGEGRPGVAGLGREFCSFLSDFYSILYTFHIFHARFEEMGVSGWQIGM